MAIFTKLFTRLTMKQFQYFFVLLLIAICVRGECSCSKKSAPKPVADQCSADAGDCSAEPKASFLTSHLGEKPAEESQHAQEGESQCQCSASDGVCEAKTNDAPKSETIEQSEKAAQPESGDKAEVKTAEGGDNSDKADAKPTEDAIEKTDEPKKELTEEEKKKQEAEEKRQKEWDVMSEEEKDKLVKEYCMNKVCDTYKRIVDAKILGGFNSEDQFFDGRRLKDLVKGAANEYLDEVLQYALGDIQNDKLKDEIFDLKDKMEVDFEEQFRRYFAHFKETTKDKLIPWSLREGETMMQGYRQMCMNFFTSADEALQKHGLALDLRALI